MSGLKITLASDLSRSGLNGSPTTQWETLRQYFITLECLILLTLLSILGFHDTT